MTQVVDRDCFVDRKFFVRFYQSVKFSSCMHDVILSNLSFHEAVNSTNHIPIVMPFEKMSVHHTPFEY